MKQYKTILRILSALAMIAIGAKHFTNPEPFVKIVPSALSHPLALVYTSGFFEVLGGIGLLFSGADYEAQKRRVNDCNVSGFNG